ncbi:MAG TPA: DNA replication and repair protein RecF [Polyangiaceae bacterium]|nr:DNA replication and repair protein RecF [Polyangiaceae bacterium]
MATGEAAPGAGAPPPATGEAAAKAGTPAPATGEAGAPPPLWLARLEVQNVRNLERVELEPSRRLTVLAGANGQGKTSVLEAIYLAATSKSFRTPRLDELVRHGAAAGRVRAVFREGTSAVGREQVVGVEGARRSVKLDGKRPPSLGHFAVRSPVVCFHARELELTSGPAAARRLMLDRLALFVDPLSADDRARYQQALRARQRALEKRGPTGADVGAFEALCARHGAALTRARRRAAGALSAWLGPSIERLSPGLRVEAAYEAGGSDDEGEAAAALSARRGKDVVRGSAGFGPHRDELALRLEGQPLRAVASQGQHRAVTLGLKVAELRALGAARGLWPVLLLDDLSSELDEAKTRALLLLLHETGGQVFVTTTRPGLLDEAGFGPAERSIVTLSGGRLLRPAGAASNPLVLAAPRPLDRDVDWPPRGAPRDGGGGRFALDSGPNLTGFSK